MGLLADCLSFLGLVFFLYFTVVYSLGDWKYVIEMSIMLLLVPNAGLLPTLFFIYFLMFVFTYNYYYSLANA